MQNADKAKRPRNATLDLRKSKHKIGVPLPDGRVLRLHYRRFKVGKRWHQVLVGPIVDLTKAKSTP